MPKCDEEVLVSRFGKLYIGWLVKNRDSSKYEWHFDEFIIYTDDIDEVEAWMPLPNPYIRDDNE